MEDKIKRLIEERQHEGAKIVLVSGGGTAPTREMLEKMGLEPEDVIVTGDSFGPAHSEAYGQLTQMQEMMEAVEEVPLFQNRAARREAARRERRERRR